jgi:hypothetical protein
MPRGGLAEERDRGLVVAKLFERRCHCARGGKSAARSSAHALEHRASLAGTAGERVAVREHAMRRFRLACWERPDVRLEQRNRLRGLSRVNRSAERPSVSSGAMTLTTTCRPSAVSVATQTRDMPPPPSSRSRV